MQNAPTGARAMFRVWAAGYANWQPAHSADVPPEATAIEPIDEGCLSEAQAQVMVEGFNQQMLRGADHVWAIAVPVAIRYEGDAQAGSAVRGHCFAEPEVS